MDYSLQVRRAIMAAMKFDTGIAALIPAANQYPSTVPPEKPAKPVAGQRYREWPFTRYGAPIAAPFRTSGLNSSSIRVTLHAFTRQLLNAGGAIIETAEDRSWKMAAAIKTGLDGRVLPIEGGMHVTLSWIGSNSIMDGDEPDAWHAIVNLLAEVAG
jgi:hypothetical protein